MANASEKRVAVNNKNKLALFLWCSVAIYGPAYLFFIFSDRPFLLQVLFALPGLLAQYLLQKWCQPRYGPNKVLQYCGEDIEQAGLIDYVKDVMFMTWFSVLLAIGFGTKFWLTMLVVPIFFAYKAFGLTRQGLSMFRPPRQDPRFTHSEYKPQIVSTKEKKRAATSTTVRRR